MDDSWLMDWDLQAIVRGCSTSSEVPEGSIIEDPQHLNFSQYFCSHHDFLISTTTFPEFSETTSVLDELAELYKPFYPILHPLSPQTITPIPQQQVKESSSCSSQQVQDLQDPVVYKCKKSSVSKKKQKQRVVKEVKADGVCDTWAWRKYGQKPIKGSPYPRSYYRCSTSKGCLARKQVERSHLDPALFIVTYTAEHSHHHPPRTRKNNNTKIKYDSNIASQTLTQTIQPSASPTPNIELNQGFNMKKQESPVLHDQDTSDEPAGTLDYDWIPSIEELNGLSQEFALLDHFPHT